MPSPAASAIAMSADLATADPSSQLDGLANPFPHGTNSEEQKLIKAAKARDSRHRETCVYQWQQDLLQFYVGIKDGPQQCPGNAVRSGLKWTKEFISESSNVLLAHFLQQNYQEALKHQALNLWQENMQQIVQQAQITENPMLGAWIVDQDTAGRLSTPECEKGQGRECLVHGHPEWFVCRYERRFEALRRNSNRYLESLRRPRASGPW